MLTENPIHETFKDITAFQVVRSAFKVMWQIYKQQGLKMSLRVVPIVWTLIVAIRGFAHYHFLEYERIQKANESDIDPEEAVLSINDYEKFKQLGSYLCKRLNQLGPTFIKIGQMFSTRADLLPLPAMLELAKLQEEVIPFANDIAFAQIASDLGKSKEALYASFDETPIAAASLSQAYKARLLDGREVVVKVQRPQLRKIITSDVQIIAAIANEVMNYPTLCRHTDWPSVVVEFAKTIYEEIDYLKEGRNADRFRHNLRKFESVCIPRIIWKLTGRHVLTIEYIGGAKITDVKAITDMGFSVDEITKLGAEFYLKQLLDDGFFHADPHPGNMRVMPDGRVGIFDFGMVGRLSPDLKQNLVNAFIHVLRNDYMALIQDFINMKILSDTVDKEALYNDLSPIIQARFNTKMSKIRFKKVLFDFSDVCWRYPFSLPSEFTYIMRALLTLEGVALSINPEFDFITAALPFAQSIVIKNNGTIGNALFKEVFSQGRFDAKRAFSLIKAAAKFKANYH